MKTKVTEDFSNELLLDIDFSEFDKVVGFQATKDEPKIQDETITDIEIPDETEIKVLDEPEPDPVQYIANPNEEFELDVYIKYIENNLKKYKENNNDYHSIIIIPTPTDDVPVQEEKKEENVINTDKPIEEAKPKEETPTPSSGGGLFSKIGRAFGFMRKTQTVVHPEMNDNKIKENLYGWH